MATTRSSRVIGADFGDLEVLEGDFGDRRRRHHKKKSSSYYGLFGDATKRKLKRPYKRSVVRKGRKLVGKHKIGQVAGARKSEFKWVTRRGGVYAATVSKGHGRRKAARKGKKK